MHTGRSPNPYYGVGLMPAQFCRNLGRFLPFWLCCVPLAPRAFGSDPLPDVQQIMAKVAANVESSTEARRQYVYHQRVRSSLVRASGQLARKEKREYEVIPGEKHTEKKLVTFAGEYRKGKDMVPYSTPGYTYKDVDIDGELINEITNDLVNEKDSRDGIPHSLFPLSSRDLFRYAFTLKGEGEYQGRRIYRIGFVPQKKELCVQIGGDHEGDCDSAWKGEAWIDAEELQPVRIQTDLAFAIPWGVRVFLGTNLRQTGFSVTYRRVAENVWFPDTYGTEFRFDVLWAYKRTVTLSLESDGFRKADAASTIKIQGEVGSMDVKESQKGAEPPEPLEPAPSPR